MLRNQAEDFMRETRSVAVAYVACTLDHALMLNEAGVCIRVEPIQRAIPRAAPGGGTGCADSDDGALRCVGAQYVATIDPSAPGGLTRLPRVGTSMLFAAMDRSGHMYCVRAGPLASFAHCLTDESGVHHTPDGTLKLGNPAMAYGAVPADQSLPPPYPPGFPGPECAWLVQD
jgi:hypothetical protein